MKRGEVNFIKNKLDLMMQKLGGTKGSGKKKDEFQRLKEAIHEQIHNCRSKQNQKDQYAQQKK